MWNKTIYPLCKCFIHTKFKIKNGRTVAAKFDSKELKFKTPNTLVVFSNEKPDVKELSKDRWKIFWIRDGDLIDVTGIYLGKM